ncbi:MAG: hypothetical protein ACRDPA_34895, partial [Solirubrobacteraceae bacterium]
VGRRFDGWTADRLIAAAVALTLAAVVAQVVTQIIDFTVYDLRIEALNSDGHASIFGIMSLVAGLAMALAAAYRGVHCDQRGRWLLLAAIAAPLVAFRAAFPGDAVPFAVPCAVIFILVWSLTSNDPTRARNLVRVSLYILAFSFVVHIVGLRIVHALGYAGNSWPYEIKALLKHTAELAGWMLLGTGVLAGMPRFRTTHSPS